MARGTVLYRIVVADEVGGRRNAAPWTSTPSAAAQGVSRIQSSSAAVSMSASVVWLVRRDLRRDLVLHRRRKPPVLESFLHAGQADFRNCARAGPGAPRLQLGILEVLSWAEGVDPVRLRSLVRCEALGYDSLWLVGPLEAAPTRPGPPPSALSLALAHLAAETSRMRLGALVHLDADTHPLRMAEEVAVLDQLSGGRLDWAVAPADRSESGRARFEEQIAVLRHALAGEPFTWEGSHYRVPRLALAPATVQCPPPLWRLAEDRSESAAAAGDCVLRPPFGAPRPGAVPVLPAVLDADAARARERALPALERALADRGRERREVAGMAEQMALVGDPARCREQLCERQRRDDTRAVVAWPSFGGLPDEVAQRTRELLVEVVKGL